jgi:nitric-oxide synthase
VGEFANPEAERQNKEVARSELPVGLGALDWVAGGLRRNNPQTTVKWLRLLLGPVLSRFYLKTAFVFMAWQPTLPSQSPRLMQHPSSSPDMLLSKARAFLAEAYAELGRPAEEVVRELQVAEEIAATGTWTPTLEELEIGAKLAWRNSNRCIGRLFWKSLKVIDARCAGTPEDVFTALQHHLNYAFNGGRIRSAITVFRPAAADEAEPPRILNHQLLRFAGYKREGTGGVLGDPAEVPFTEFCQEIGWQGKGTAFDVLPWVVRWPGRGFAWRMPEIDPRMLVEIVHPDFSWFRELGLRWYAVPVISDMLLEIGGLQFTAAPFNGWYMETEIGSRNFGDAQRYNLLPAVAERMGLDRSSRQSLWQDRALVELNRAVLFAFEQAGVTIVDHHTAAEQFINFEQLEQRNGRPLTADWAWITPPLSGSVTPVFHRHYENTVREPNFFYQESPWSTSPRPTPAGCPFHAVNRG